MPVLELDISESPIARALLEGVESMGINIGDLNGEQEYGAMPTQSNTRNGWRVSTFDAYLNTIDDVSRTHLLANTLAIQVIFEKNKAIGVNTVNLFSGATFRIQARKEIILSAGVIGTPQLLMLSGIGPRKHLEKFNIPVVANLPGVGSNLQDELNVPLYFHISEPIGITTQKIKSHSSIWQYFSEGKGPLAGSGVEVITRLPVPENSLVHSKIYLMVFNLGSVSEDPFTAISNFKYDSFSETFPDAKNDSKEGFIILSSCTHPSSKGTIRLASTNPLDSPLINPNYLSEAEDVKCLAKAMKMAAKLGTMKQLRKYGARLHLPGYEECSKFEQSLEDDSYLECWIRTSGITSYHPVGTCAMGHDDDPLAVLDSKLRVRGVKKLRVVDSSSFPYQISGNPHAVVLMLAEKAADIILADHLK